MKKGKRKLKLPLMRNAEAAKTSTLKKLRQLQRLIDPRCDEIIMNPETLYEETASQIFQLEAKVNVLKSLLTMLGV